MPKDQVTDAEVYELAAIATELSHSYEQDSIMWEGSPFQWIKTRPSRQVGAIGEKLVATWCEDQGYAVARSPNTEADLLINGTRVEVKFSTLWTDSKQYKFQQIRDQAYDYCFCLGVSPFDAHAWYIPKAELMNDRPPALRPQHGGQAGRDTKWLSFLAEEPPEWLAEFGGALGQVRRLLARAIRSP